MSNGSLVFIIILEAIAIAWLMSKLKHYQKFEHLLSNKNATSEANGASPAQNAATVGTVTASSAGANAARAARSASAPAAQVGADTLDDDLLDMPGVEPELNIEEAKRVQLVMARCHYAEFYLEQLDDDYERGQFKHIVDSCKSTAKGIEDPFFKASALHPLILLLDRAGWEDSRDALLAQVEDELVKQRITQELNAQSA